MRTCLVTGGGGFLGMAIVKKLLAQGAAVKVLARRHHDDVEQLGAHCLMGDLADASVVDNACQECDTVFHTASKAGIWGPDSEYEKTNVLGSRNLLQACQRNRVKTLVYTSTPSVIYHPRAVIENIQEDIEYPTEFECAYARTKAQAEQELLKADGIAGVRITSLRPHLIYGPGDPHLIPRVIQRAKAGQLPQIGDGTNKVDLTYVDNAADAHLLAAEHIDTAGGQAYFISDGQPVVLWQWIGQLLQQLDIPPIKRRLPLGLTRALGACLEMVYHLLDIKTEPKMTRFTAQQLATSHYFNISKARQDLHYEPRVSGEEGLKRLVEWIKAGGLDTIAIS